MQNKGTDYIRRILRDKARQKRWRRIMLCLSCIVVFCTAYVLILPAITLEKKTTCEEEQSAIQEEQPLVQEEDESIVQSDDSDEVEFVSCEPIEEENENVEDVEIAEDPEEMDVDFASGDENSVADTADPTATPTPDQNSAGGFDLSANPGNISSIILQYYNEETKTWITIPDSGSSEIPGNASIKLAVSYINIPVETLKTSNNCTLTYQLPELLRNVVTKGTILAENQQIAGTITCQGGKIIVRFEENYLQELIDKKETTIAGDFYAEGKVNLSKLPSDGQTTLSTADKNYQLNFGQDVIAKYGKIDVEKKCADKAKITEDGNYLSYTITVTAGEDGCPDVSVVDTIVNNKTSVECYVGIGALESTLSESPNNQNPYETIAEGKSHGTVYLGNSDSTNHVPTPGAANITTAPGSMVWKIGDMAPGESRTLTYYVKLKDDVGLNGNEIKNKAEVYSQIYKRAYNEASFTPKIDYGNGMSKQADNAVRNKDGTYTISYRINFNLHKETSNYSLKNFEFLDYLNYSDNQTDSRALPYISYDRDSVKLYVKRDGEGNYTLVPKFITSWSGDDNQYMTPWSSSENPTRFKISGTNDSPITVNPGDSYYATYTVTVKPEALAAIQSDNVIVKNRYYVNTSNASKKWDYGLDRVYANKTVGGYTWDNKVVGSGTTTEKTIGMGTDAKYDLTSETVRTDSSADTSFTVPAGSYPYTVDVNQTLGDWDATKVSMTDTLSSDKMNYIGYAKVEAFEYNAYDNAYKVTGTKWVKIDGLKSFTLKPSDLGWSGVNYAYKFTYYARPADSYFSEVTVNNTFSLSGNVKRGENSFNLSGIHSQGAVTVSGSFKMNVRKDAWYYEEPKTGAATWQNGKLYWVIEVSGTAILKDTCFRDAISKDSGLTDSYLHLDSLAGIYKGKLPDGKTIIKYSNLEELLNENTLEVVTDKFTKCELSNTKNFEGDDNYSELTVKAKERIPLNDEKLYFIVRTEPQSLPVKYRDIKKYKNEISTSDNGTNWILQSNAEKNLCGGADILKELGQTFTYDGKKVTSNADGMDADDAGKIAVNGLKDTGAGQYASWAFKLNYAGELSGTYRVLEAIPNGMELAYIRIKWTGSKQGTISSKKISGTEAANWTEKSITAATDNNGRTETTTYYVRGNQALIKLGDFIAGNESDVYSVDVQVVCRVTDPDVLLGGKTKTFTNQVTLQTAEGQDINTATSSATIIPKKLDKEITSKGSERITFTIKANQLGEALPTENGQTLTLIDKLSQTLVLDTGTISIINSQTQEAVTDYKASLAEDNTLKIELPCNVPVTITYTATVNAPPGQKVSFSNEAYWEKYSSAGGDSVKEDSYSYTAGGTVTSAANVTLKIIKRDQNNLKSLLSGAEFCVVPCTRSEQGEITESKTDAKGAGTTQTDGTLTFNPNLSGSFVMKYNTIYKVTETKAPEGYMENSEPIYIMVPKMESGATDYSSYVNTCIKDPRINKKYQSTYELTVLNHKGEITVEKKFKGPGGQNANPVSGTYKFGLYENSGGTTSTTAPLQTITITYLAGETTPKIEKFVNLDLSKTYYVFELDDNGNPIKDSTTVAAVNNMEYFTSYATKKTDGTTTGVNSAVNGDTVTVTNQIRVKELPSTGSYGPLIFRLAGAVLIFFAGLQMLINIKRRACNNR